MDYITETEIRKIVKKVLDATGSGSTIKNETSPFPAYQSCNSSKQMIVAIGCDHGG